MNVAGTEIFVSGRQHKVPGTSVTYEQIVNIWNELHEAEGLYIKGTPGIDYKEAPKDDEGKENGVLWPGGKREVKDGTSFTVDPEHVA